jgi:glycerate 2-kinase
MDNLATIQHIYQCAVDAVLPDTVIPESVSLNGSTLEIGERSYELSGRNLYALAIGKAAGEMMGAFQSIAGDRIAGSVAVVKDADSGLALSSEVLVGSHPVPDERSLRAGDRVLEFARSVPDGSLVVCMISGGGSALLESLRPGVDLSELRAVTRELLNAGATIHELNAVRARLSAIKAGGLLATLGDVDVVNLIISDVLGDDLSTIASGPSVEKVTAIDADDVLSRYGIEAHLSDERREPTGKEPYSLIVGNLEKAIGAATHAATRSGLTPVILTGSLEGEAKHVGSTIAAIVADTRYGRTSFREGTCFIAGGETTVTVTGDGTGGRNTEAALAAALRLSGIDNVVAGFLASDGDDAETGVAGGIVDGNTVSAIDRQQALIALADNDSFTYLQRRGAAWGSGPTGTNVNDLVIAIVG